jgi:urease accessory protein
VTARGSLSARFCVRAGRTELVNLRCQPPLQALRALRVGQAAELMVATLGPGLMGGDHLRLEVEAEPGADARITSTAATRVLPTRNGRGAEGAIRLTVADGARLSYLPRPTILQAGAAYRQRIEVDLGRRALALIGDVVVPGRLASGEAFAFAELDASLTVRDAGGDLLVVERQRLAPAELDPLALGALPGGDVVLASLFVLTPDRDLRGLGDAVAERLPACAGLTALPNDAGLLVRALLPSAQAAEGLLSEAAAPFLSAPPDAGTRGRGDAGTPPPS